MKYALIGHPLTRSRSPEIHARLFELSKIRASYDLLDTENVSDALPKLKRLSGFNVTIPHKQAVIPYLAGMSEIAKKCGAVNTVKREGKNLYGHNTDADGFRKSLKGLLGKNTCGDGTALVLGAGGVARTIVAELEKLNFCVTVAVRDVNSENALSLKRDFAVKIIDITTIVNASSLLINATPVGMYTDTDELPIAKEVVLGAKAVFDTVASPSPTNLVKLVAAHGIPAKDGVEMLVLQAAAAHEFWYGAKFLESDIKTIIDGLRGGIR